MWRQGWWKGYHTYEAAAERWNHALANNLVSLVPDEVSAPSNASCWPHNPDNDFYDDDDDETSQPTQPNSQKIPSARNTPASSQRQNTSSACNAWTSSKRQQLTPSKRQQAKSTAVLHSEDNLYESDVPSACNARTPSKRQQPTPSKRQQAKSTAVLHSKDDLYKSNNSQASTSSMYSTSAPQPDSSSYCQQVACAMADHKDVTPSSASAQRSTLPNHQTKSSTTKPALRPSKGPSSDMQSTSPAISNEECFWVVERGDVPGVYAGRCV
ncbi:hypothetical protein C0992_010770 [Termitomyces sp. T32_za158]|nr:hypothetical protein C0992_010770 [Termitomyces sp. T32_za158]